MGMEEGIKRLSHSPTRHAPQGVIIGTVILCVSRHCSTRLEFLADKNPEMATSFHIICRCLQNCKNVGRAHRDIFRETVMLV